MIKTKTLLILPLLLTGCYVKRDIGMTNYLYDKCEEYYDASGTYHKVCPESLTTKIYKDGKKLYFLMSGKKTDTSELRAQKLQLELDRLDKKYKCKRLIRLDKVPIFDDFDRYDTKVQCVR